MNAVEFLLLLAAAVGIGGFSFASGYMYGVRWALNKYAEIEQAKLKEKNHENRLAPGLVARRLP